MGATAYRSMSTEPVGTGPASPARHQLAAIHGRRNGERAQTAPPRSNRELTTNASNGLRSLAKLAIKPWVWRGEGLGPAFGGVGDLE